MEDVGMSYTKKRRCKTAKHDIGDKVRVQLYNEEGYRDGTIRTLRSRNKEPQYYVIFKGINGGVSATWVRESMVLGEVAEEGK